MHATFSGNSRRARNVNLSGQQNRNPFASAWAPTGTSQTVSHAQAERQKRQQERDRLNACRRIQRTWRSYKVRKDLREIRRGTFDQTYGPSGPADPEVRIEVALPLLLASFRPDNAADCQRVSKVVDDLGQVRMDLFISDPKNGYKTGRLAAVLVEVLEHGTPEHRYLALLATIASSSPQSLSKSLDRYYALLARLSVNPPEDKQTLDAIQQAIISPLWTGLLPMYRSFASKYLSTPHLPLHGDLMQSQKLDMEKLGAAIISLYQEPGPQPPTENQLWRLAYFIHLHQTVRTQPTGQSIYLQALQIQLEQLAGIISLRTSVDVGGASQADNNNEGDTEDSKAGIQPLPEAVATAIISLVDRDGISSLLDELSRTSEDTDGASLLAGYIIVLLRCFPSRGDDIRMRLFLGDVASASDGAVPVIKYLWHSVRRSKVYSRVVSDSSSSSITGLVRAYLSNTDGSNNAESAKAERRDWRIILLFLELYTFILRLSDDDDFFSCIRPSLLTSQTQPSRLRSCGLSLPDVQSLTTFLKNLSFTLLYDGPGIMESLRATVEGTAPGNLDAYFSHGSEDKVTVDTRETDHSTRPDLGRLRDIVTAVLHMLYERDSRRPFLPASHWLMTSKFDMGRFVDAVVVEQERQQNEVASGDSDDDGSDVDGDVTMGGIHSTTLAGQRLSRHAQIERLRAKQKKAQRNRMMSVIGPKLEVLKHMPFAIPFATRVEIFRKFIDVDKMKRRAGLDADTWQMSMVHNPLTASTSRYSKHRATVTRGSEFDDAYEQFFDIGDGLKEPIQIQFVDRFGEVEAGIDGGGVTKEFLTSAIDAAFSSTEGHYFASNSQGLIFPNPLYLDQVRDMMRQQNCTPAEIHDEVQDTLRRYEFLGRIVGKCLYEGILVDISFAGFFLLKWISGQTSENSYRGNLNDLRDLDEALYQGMLKLKNYRGNVADMGLDFTIEDQVSRADEPLRTVSRDLVPNGANVTVTNDNRLLYISYVARHRLVAQPAQQTAAFLRGLRAMIAPSWLSMFNQNELQRLVGGDSSEIDIDDLRRNTQYSGLYDPGYSKEDHPTVELFWKVVRSFTDEQRRLLLKYVTSTPRAPLLGFSQLNPKFAIRDGGTDEERLPSTSTCVNLLKLPRYTDEATLRRKLLQAIESGAGFDLS
ncbi:HECT-domain-containing protein [Plectosphaerella cucumerina]|uniref:HECT-type E3 ubiquitin transferase n=1 Tax=Plectosphaerella cucumerina TaxID=40658 RepID=A0A8K0XA24_9PEZI|nr:HECT-domain-containing protein [Plectosphaerella cucumerina]